MNNLSNIRGCVSTYMVLQAATAIFKRSLTINLDMKRAINYHDYKKKPILVLVEEVMVFKICTGHT